MARKTAAALMNGILKEQGCVKSPFEKGGFRGISNG
jgi:hypothetical protein